MKEIKTTEKDVIDKFYRALVLLPRWKRKLIMWLWPEIVEAANFLRKHLWGESR